MGQAKIHPTPTGTSLAGKIAIITGASSGLGLETARQYLLLGIERLIITARTAAKGQEAIETLRNDVAVAKTNPDATIDAFELELEDYGSVIRFCEKAKAEVPELHILLNNAGLTTTSFRTTKDGHERTMQVHVYAPIHISQSLLPLLRLTAQKTGQPTHLTFTGSTMHNGSKLPYTLYPSPTTKSTSTTTLAPPTTLLPHLSAPTTWNALSRYPDSKLLLALLVSRLAQTTPSSAVIIMHLCPGLVRTGLDRQLPSWLKALMWGYRRISGREVEEGARTLVFATCLLGEEGHGRFVSDNMVREDAEVVKSEAGQKVMKMLWEELEEERARLGL